MRNRLDKQWLDLTNITEHGGVSQEIWIGRFFFGLFVFVVAVSMQAALGK